MDSVFPSAVAKNIFRIIKIEGLAKLSYTLMSMTPPAAMLQLSTSGVIIWRRTDTSALLRALQCNECVRHEQMC